VTAPPTRWLTVSRTITRIWTETGRLLTAKDVMALGRKQGGLRVEQTHDHVRVSEDSLTQYLLLYGRRRAGIPVGQGAELPEHIEDEFQRGKADYTDTPNDEGDNEQ
jgi:hypothetical protein